MKAILGIDPGVEGGLALRAPGWAAVELLPVVDGQLDIQEFAQWLALRRDEIGEVWLERAGIRPGQAPQQCAKQWRMLGQIEAVLLTAGFRYSLVAAHTWSAAFAHGVTETDKHKRYTAIKRARRTVVAQLFPQVDLRASARSSVPHDGMTDAILIAEWAFRRQKLQQRRDA